MVFSPTRLSPALPGNRAPNPDAEWRFRCAQRGSLRQDGGALVCAAGVRRWSRTPVRWSKKHQVNLPHQSEPWNLRHLLTWIKENLLKERPELFVQGDSVRPGILVLVNDADWELMGNLDYQLQDRITWFSSPPYNGG